MWALSNTPSLYCHNGKNLLFLARPAPADCIEYIIVLSLAAFPSPLISLQLTSTLDPICLSLYPTTDNCSRIPSQVSGKPYVASPQHAISLNLAVVLAPPLAVVCLVSTVLVEKNTSFLPTRRALMVDLSTRIPIHLRGAGRSAMILSLPNPWFISLTL